MTRTTMTLRCAYFLTTTCAVLLLASFEREPPKPPVDAKSAPAPAPVKEPPKPDPTGLDRTKAASQSMESVRAELQKGKLQIDSTLSALASVVKEAEGNPKPSFDSFVKGLGELETQAAAARMRADDMRINGQAYFDGWAKDLKAISSESVRDVASERMEDLKENYDEITKASAKVKETYQPFITQLTEVRKALQNDLTAKGIDQISGQAKKAKKNGEDVNEAIDALNEKLNQLAERIAGTKKR